MGPTSISGSETIWWEDVAVTGALVLAADDPVVLIDSTIHGPLTCAIGTVAVLIGTTATGPVSGCG